MKINTLYILPFLLPWLSHDLVHGAPASPALSPALHVGNASDGLVQTVTTITTVHMNNRLVIDYALEGHALDNKLAARTIACIDQAYRLTRTRKPGNAPFTGEFAYYAPMQVHLAPSPAPAVGDKCRMTNDEAALAWLMLADIVVKVTTMREMEFDVYKEGRLVARGKVLKA